MALAAFPNSINPAGDHDTAGSVSAPATHRCPVAVGPPAFSVTAHGSPMTFDIDDDAFATWVADEGDGLTQRLPPSGTETPGSTLSDLVYAALSAGALVGDPGLELNVHGDGVGYLLRLNNAGGRQQLVGLTRGWHELERPPEDLSPSERARYCLQQICDIANTLLSDLLAPL